jgi:hypothetical protein
MNAASFLHNFNLLSQISDELGVVGVKMYNFIVTLHAPDLIISCYRWKLVRAKYRDSRYQRFSTS